MVKKLYVGAHISIAHGYNGAIKDILKIEGNAVQIFLKNPRGRAGKKLDMTDVEVTNKLIKENDVFLVGHCSYLLNFAKPLQDNKWAVENLLDDLIRISKLGGIGVVLHIGKYLKMSKKEAFKNIIDNINYVIKHSPKDVYIIWENTAGQGTEIGYRIEELKELYELLPDKKRIRFCLDTCHAFAAGYNLSTKEGVHKWREEFDKLIGWEKVLLIHFNDAMKECGSRVDRHAKLLEGKIGEEGLKKIAKIAYETEKPMILETPQDYEGYHKEILLIKKWISKFK